MELQYHLTIEDFFQYHEYNLKRTRSRIGRCWRWLPGLALAAVVPAAFGGYADPLGLMLGFGLGGLWAALIPCLGRGLTRRRFLKNWASRDASGDYRLELSDDGLLETAGDRTARFEWNMVQKVAINGPRLYIYIETPARPRSDSRTGPGRASGPPHPSAGVVIVPLEIFRDITHYNQFMARLAAGTGLPLDILKISENFDQHPARPPKGRRRRWAG